MEKNKKKQKAEKHAVLTISHYSTLNLLNEIKNYKEIKEYEKAAELAAEKGLILKAFGLYKDGIEDYINTGKLAEEKDGAINKYKTIMCYEKAKEYCIKAAELAAEKGLIDKAIEFYQSCGMDSFAVELAERAELRDLARMICYRGIIKHAGGDYAQFFRLAEQSGLFQPKPWSKNEETNKKIEEKYIKLSEKKIKCDFKRREREIKYKKMQEEEIVGGGKNGK